MMWQNPPLNHHNSHDDMCICGVGFSGSSPATRLGEPSHGSTCADTAGPSAGWITWGAGKIDGELMETYGKIIGKMIGKMMENYTSS